MILFLYKELFIKKPKDKDQSRKFPYNLKDRNQLAAEHAVWTEFAPLLLNSKAFPLPPDHTASMNYGQGSVISHLSVLRPGSRVQLPYFSVLHPPQSHSSFKDLLSAHPVPGAELSRASGIQKTGRYSPVIRREAFPHCEHSPLAPSTIWSASLGASSLPTLFYHCLLLQILFQSGHLSLEGCFWISCST